MAKKNAVRKELAKGKSAHRIVLLRGLFGDE
jgi:hypothetical protein